MDAEFIFALRAPDGRRVLADAVTAVSDGADDLTILSSLRKRSGPELAAAALTQARLRERASRRLGEDAASMFFTADGVEQATRPEVSARRAARYAAHTDAVLDAGCGIGGDAIAFARAGLRVHAVDRDPVTAAVCRANVEELGLADLVTVSVADVSTFGDAELEKWPAAFCDPARRTGGRRVFDPAAYSPSWDFLLRLAGLVRLTGVKVAPGIDHDLVPFGVEAEWVSTRGDSGRVVVEAALWWASLATAPRRATLLPAGDTLTGPGDDAAGATSAPVGAVGSWLYEPDGAVIRAGLVAPVARAVEGRLLDPRIAYVTADDLVQTPFATAYEVIDAMPFAVKRVRAALRDLGVGRVTVKKRGVNVDPDDVRRQLKPAGDPSMHAVVVLTRIGSAATALICRPPAGRASQR